MVKYIDNIELPINVNINPHYEKVKNSSNLWIINNNLVTDIESKFIEWDIPFYTSLAYVDCSLNKLRPLCDYFSWLFLIDDVAEKLNENEVRKLFKGTLEIIEFNKTSENDIWSNTFLDIWKRMNMSFKNKDELLKSKKEYIQGVINQKKIKFNIVSYLENRKMDVGSKILSTLIKHSYDLEIDDKYTDDISKTMGYCFGLSNDIYSFKNEKSYNIINVIMEEKKYELEKAMFISKKMLQINIYKLIEACEHSNINIDYLNGLKSIVSATMYWTKNNPRYNYRDNNININIINIKNDNYKKYKQNILFKTEF